MDIVIGLIGAKGAGKTVAFNAISSILEVQEITLAAKIKDACASIFNLPRECFEKRNMKEAELEIPVYLDRESIYSLFQAYRITFSASDIQFENKYVRPHIGKILHTPRHLLQYAGTDILRAYETDIHCSSAVFDASKKIGVVTDMRFLNEREFFAKKYSNFQMIYIQNMAAEITASDDPHASEKGLKALAKLAQFTVSNNDSLKDFTESIKAVARVICA